MLPEDFKDPRVLLARNIANLSGPIQKALDESTLFRQAFNGYFHNFLEPNADQEALQEQRGKLLELGEYNPALLDAVATLEGTIKQTLG
jgi:hypothetical protein